MKICSRCKQTKSIDQFRKDSRRKDGRTSPCAVCHRDYENEQYKKSRVRARRLAYQRKVHYQLTCGQYNELVDKMGNRCYICLQPEPRQRAGRTMNLAVDHNHITNKVRGILCSNCNAGLGHFFDDPLRLRAAAMYLEIANE